MIVAKQKIEALTRSQNKTGTVTEARWAPPLKSASPLPTTESPPDGIATEQLRAILARYTATLAAAAERRGPSVGDRELDRASGAIALAARCLAVGRRADAHHALGIVQGILLCKGLHTWEELALDAKR